MKPVGMSGKGPKHPRRRARPNARCHHGATHNRPNRRVRTRMHGGVGGVGPRGPPLSRSTGGAQLGASREKRNPWNGLSKPHHSPGRGVSTKTHRNHLHRSFAPSGARNTIEIEHHGFRRPLKVDSLHPWLQPTRPAGANSGMSSEIASVHGVAIQGGATLGRSERFLQRATNALDSEASGRAFS